jgi:hypothetical protein
MKSMNTIFFSLVLIALSAGTANAQYEVLWERNDRTGALATKPTWFGADTERGIAYGVVGGNERVYVLSRNGGNSIRVLNPATGADVTLDTPFTFTGVSGGTFTLNDIEITDDGVTVASNLAVGTAASPLKFYFWTSEGGNPVHTYSFTGSGFSGAGQRMGDKITVKGSWSAGTIEIWTAVATTTPGVVYVHRTTDQGANWTVTTITLSGGTTAIVTNPDVEPISLGGSSDFYVSANGGAPRRHSSAGAFVSGSVVGDTGSHNGLGIVQGDGYTFLSTYQFRETLDSETPRRGMVKTWNITTATATQLTASPRFRDGAVDLAASINGDVAIKSNSDGSFVVFALGTGQGLMAYNMQKAVTLTGSSGFRTLASPVANTRLSELFHGLWTQGFTGSGNTGFTSNIYFHPNGTNNFVSATNITNQIAAGHGVLAAVYADNDPNTSGVQGGFPKTLNVYGTTNTGDVAVTPTHTSGDEYFLAGNPYMSTIDWDLVTKGADVYNVAWVLGSDGEFDSWNGSGGDLTDGLIAPFQGFFYAYSGSASTVTFTEASKSSGGTFRGKEETPLVARIALSRDGRENATWLQFAENGTFGRDRYDAPKMTSLSSDVMQVSTLEVGSGAAMDIHYLPMIREALTLTLPINAARGGTFTLSMGSSTLPDGWTVLLHDAVTGTTTDLAHDTYTFTSEALSASVPRFTLIVEPGTSTSTPDAGRSTPDAFALEQNYPNPFNPSTVIRFTLDAGRQTRLAVFDVLGREIAVLVNGTMPAGAHSVTFDASGLSSGTYIYRLEAGGQVLTRRMTLVK